jgi:hypothetical protein
MRQSRADTWSVVELNRSWRLLGRGVLDLEDVGGHYVFAPQGEVKRVRHLLDAANLLDVSLEHRRERKEAEVGYSSREPRPFQEFRSLELAQNRQLHHVGSPVLLEKARKEPQ